MGRILNAAAELLHSSFQNAVVAKDAAKHVIAKHARTTSRGDAEVQRLGESTHPGYRQNSMCTINPKRAIWRASLWLRAPAGVVGGRGQAPKASSLGQRTALSSTKMQELVGDHGLSRAILVSVIAGASRLFMQLLTSVKVQGQEHLEAALSRPSGQALITVSNHVTGIDDPLVISRLVPARQLFGDARALRWTMCATDRCFKYSLLTPFFRACKVLPVERGAGLDQPGMHAAQALLSQGEWLHVFPEGTRSVDGRLGCVKPGVAALVAALDHEPLLLPFVHAGMERVVPRGKKVPRPGQRVAVVVGEPIPTADLKRQAQQQGWDEQRLLKELRNRVQLHLHRLKMEADALTLQSANSSLSEVSSAAQLLLPQAHSAAAAAASSASRWAEAAQWPLPSSFSVALAGACCQRPQAWLQDRLGVPSAADSWRSYLQGYAAERRRRVEALLSIGAY